MVTILTILFIVICPLIIFVVLVQDPKGGGLAGVLGGAGGTAAFGAKTADVVMKTTVALGILFFLLALGLGLRLKEPSAAVKTDLGAEETVEAPAAAEEEQADEAESPAAAEEPAETPTAEPPAGEDAETGPAEDVTAPAPAGAGTE